MTILKVTVCCQNTRYSSLDANYDILRERALGLKPDKDRVDEYLTQNHADLHKLQVQFSH